MHRRRSGQRTASPTPARSLSLSGSFRTIAFISSHSRSGRVLCRDLDRELAGQRRRCRYPSAASGRSLLSGTPHTTLPLRFAGTGVDPGNPSIWTFNDGVPPQVGAVVETQIVTRRGLTPPARPSPSPCLIWPWLMTLLFFSSGRAHLIRQVTVRDDRGASSTRSVAVLGISRRASEPGTKSQVWGPPVRGRAPTKIQP
jgi:hypothetical protein